jgi:hypothetical protein
LPPDVQEALWKKYRKRIGFPSGIGAYT